MALDILTPDQLAKVRDAALRKADWYEARPVSTTGQVGFFQKQTRDKLVRGLRHTAADCQAAIDGCETSMDSVLVELDEDGDLARAAYSYVPAMGAAA
jgi:hypothetical protein